MDKRRQKMQLQLDVVFAEHLQQLAAMDSHIAYLSLDTTKSYFVYYEHKLIIYKNVNADPNRSVITR
jgi:hypothetical protein